MPRILLALAASLFALQASAAIQIGPEIPLTQPLSRSGDTLLGAGSAGVWQVIVARDADAMTLRAQRAVGAAISGPAMTLDDAVTPPDVAVSVAGPQVLTVWCETGLDGDAVKVSVIGAGDGPSRPAGVATGQKAMRPDVVWTGDHYLVTWTRPYLEGADDRYLMAMTVAADGTLLSTPHRVTSAVPNAGFAKVVDTPAGLVAVFSAGQPFFYRGLLPMVHGDIYAARMSDSGDFTSSAVQLTATDQIENVVTSAAADGDGDIAITFGRAPIDYHYGPSGQVAAVLSPSLGVISSTDLKAAASASIAWTGSSFALAYSTNRLYITALARTGESLLEPAAVTDRPATPYFAPAPAGALLVYSRSVESDGSTVLRTVGRMLHEQIRRRSVRRE